MLRRAQIREWEMNGEKTLRDEFEKKKIKKETKELLVILGRKSEPPEYGGN